MVPLAVVDWVIPDVSLSPGTWEGLHLVTGFEGTVSFPVLVVALHGAPLLRQMGTADAPLTHPLSASPS